MDVRIYHFMRSQGKGTIVYSVGNGPMIEKNFHAEMKDAEVLASIGCEKAKQESKPAEPEVKNEPEPEPEEASKPKESVNQQMESRRELKKRYIEDLLKVGIDKSKDPSFARIEAAWKKNCVPKS